jgi:hypothetical protein
VLLLFLALLFFLPVRLCFLYDGSISLRLKVLCFSFPLYPRKKKWKMKDHLPEYQKKKMGQPAKKETEKQEAAPQKPREDKTVLQKIEEFYSFTKRLLDRVICPLLERLGKHLTVRISRLEVVIGSENAAKSALLHAVAVNAGYAVFALLDNYAKLRKAPNADISVSCPFTERKSSILCELEFGIHLYGALFTLLPALYTYFTEFTEQDPSLLHKRKEIQK